MRGSPATIIACAGEQGIIPAHAGLTLCSHIVIRQSWDHPRACGAHPVWFQKRLMMGDVLYSNKKRTTEWIKTHTEHQALEGLSIGSSFFSSIPTEKDLVKLKKSNPAMYQGQDINESMMQSANGTHGSIAQMSNGQRIISLFESADESTFLHEMGHMFLLDLEDLAQIDEVSDKELHIVQEWASWHPDDYKLYENSSFAKEWIIPAHAGLTYTRTPHSGSVRDHPRACGAHLYNPCQPV